MLSPNQLSKSKKKPVTEKSLWYNFEGRCEGVQFGLLFFSSGGEKQLNIILSCKAASTHYHLIVSAQRLPLKVFCIPCEHTKKSVSLHSIYVATPKWVLQYVPSYYNIRLRAQKNMWSKYIIHEENVVLECISLACLPKATWLWGLKSCCCDYLPDNASAYVYVQHMGHPPAASHISDMLKNWLD